jgi:hypothetical protein
MSTALGMLPLMTFVPVEGDASREYVRGADDGVIQLKLRLLQLRQQGGHGGIFALHHRVVHRAGDAAADDLCAGGR